MGKSWSRPDELDRSSARGALLPESRLAKMLADTASRPLDNMSR